MIAGILSVAAPAYVVVGLAVALAILLAGLDQVDPQARGAYWFRPLLIPGLVLLWPVVLVRWRSLAARRGDPPPRQIPNRRLHLWAWRVLEILLPLAILLAVIARAATPSGPAVEPLPPMADPAGDAQ